MPYKTCPLYDATLTQAHGPQPCRREACEWFDAAGDCCAVLSSARRSDASPKPQAKRQQMIDRG